MTCRRVSTPAARTASSTPAFPTAPCSSHRWQSSAATPSCASLPPRRRGTASPTPTSPSEPPRRFRRSNFSRELFYNTAPIGRKLAAEAAPQSRSADDRSGRARPPAQRHEHLRLARALQQLRKLRLVLAPIGLVLARQESLHVRLGPALVKGEDVRIVGVAVQVAGEERVLLRRSEERRVGEEGVRTCRTWWSPEH